MRLRRLNVSINVVVNEKMRSKQHSLIYKTDERESPQEA